MISRSFMIFMPLPDHSVPLKNTAVVWATDSREIKLISYTCNDLFMAHDINKLRMERKKINTPSNTRH